MLGRGRCGNRDGSLDTEYKAPGRVSGMKVSTQARSRPGRCGHCFFRCCGIGRVRLDRQFDHGPVWVGLWLSPLLDSAASG